MTDDARALEDRNAIEQLIYCYSDAVTRADYVQMATVFADDAVWESPILGMHFETRPRVHRLPGRREHRSRCAHPDGEQPGDRSAHR